MTQPLDLPDGGRMTNNNKGMEMSTLSPLFEEWVQSYDGEHPLVDLGLEDLHFVSEKKSVAHRKKISRDVERVRAKSVEIRKSLDA